MSEEENSRGSLRFALGTVVLGAFLAGVLVAGNILLGKILFGTPDSWVLADELRAALVVSSLASLALWVAVMAIWSKSASNDAKDSAS